MKENQRNQRDMDQRSNEQENMRNPQQDRTREVGQNREQNESLRDAEQGSGRSYDYGTQGSEQTENTSSGSSLNSGTGRRESVAGTTDMRDEQALGRSRNNSRRQPGSGSGLAPKTGTTGSDYDGQNSI